MTATSGATAVQPAATASPAASKPASTSSRTILIVDDDRQAARMAEATLRQAGYQPLIAASALEALDAVIANAPDAVVVDLIMPDIDGFEFIARYRRLAEGRPAPIVVWTVKDLTADERHRLEAMGVV